MDPGKPKDDDELSRWQDDGLAAMAMAMRERNFGVPKPAPPPSVKPRRKPVAEESWLPVRTLADGTEIECLKKPGGGESEEFRFKASGREPWLLARSRPNAFARLLLREVNGMQSREEYQRLRERCLELETRLAQRTVADVNLEDEDG